MGFAEFARKAVAAAHRWQAGRSLSDLEYLSSGLRLDEKTEKLFLKALSRAPWHAADPKAQKLLGECLEQTASCAFCFGAEEVKRCFMGSFKKSCGGDFEKASKALELFERNACHVGPGALEAVSGQSLSQKAQQGRPCSPSILEQARAFASGLERERLAEASRVPAQDRAGPAKARGL